MSASNKHLLRILYIAKNNNIKVSFSKARKVALFRDGICSMRVELYFEGGELWANFNTESMSGNDPIDAFVNTFTRWAEGGLFIGGGKNDCSNTRSNQWLL